MEVALSERFLVQSPISGCEVAPPFPVGRICNFLPHLYIVLNILSKNGGPVKVDNWAVLNIGLS